MERKMDKYIAPILKKMCKIINVNYKEIKFNELGWYNEHTWTKEQEEKFRLWLEDYLYENNNIRKELLKNSVKNKKIIKSAVSEFLLNFGWKTI